MLQGKENFRPSRARFQELWATLTLRAEYQPLEQAPCELPPVGRQLSQGSISPSYGYACTDYDVRTPPQAPQYRCNAFMLSRALKPNITHQEPLTASHRGVIFLV